MPADSRAPLGATDPRPPSRTEAAMRAAKLRRVKAMDAWDRMKLALRLGRRLRSLTSPERP